MVRRGVAFILILVLGLSIVASNTVTEVFIQGELIDDNRVFELSYDVHAPFNITSNSDFETQSWPGNGSVINPYRIQNLNITSTDSICIWITNTTSHFIIEDCLFSSSYDSYMIHQPSAALILTNVSNGMVEGNYIMNSFSAVSGYLLSNCSISENNFSIESSGIYLVASNSTMVANNTQGYEPCNNGITLSHCRNCTISRNEFKNVTTIGLWAWGSYDLQILQNTLKSSTSEFTFGWAGLQVWGDYCKVQGNVISDFEFLGIDAGGHNLTVSENNITSCTTGIKVTTIDSTFTANNINSSFTAIEMVQANDTVVYENTILGRRAYETGIAIHGGHDCDVYLNDISQVHLGIYLQGATRFNISRNSVTDGRYGFAFGWFSNWGVHEGQFFDCDIIDNTFDGGGLLPRIDNYESWEFYTIRFIGNTVHGEPIGFFANRDQETIDGNDFGQLLLVSCNEITISGGNFHDISSDRVGPDFYDPGDATAIKLLNCTACSLSNVNFINNTVGISLQDSSQCSITGGTGYYNSWRGISLADSYDIDISNVDIRNSPIGIELSWSYDCSISDSYLSDNDEGMGLQTSMNCIISRNSIFRNTNGMYLEDSDGSEIFGNTVHLNGRGILLNSTSGCLITQNNVANNTGVGICLDRTANQNEIFNNTFAYNSPNAICEGALNHWDNQIDTGNWWSDYSGEGPYIIDENDQDNFPFTIEPTTTTNGTTGSGSINPLLYVYLAGVGVVTILAYIIFQRRRVEVID